MNIIQNGKSLILAYDHGIEHGPTDFNDRSVDPDYVMQLALKGRFNAIAVQKGIAEKYYKKYRNVPLILKLNGKTNLIKGDPYSPQICSVKEAISLGTKAVGYTIYLGSVHEAKMFKEFSKIEEQAHKKNLKVVAWIYPRGKKIKNELAKDVLAYAARVGLELGADIIKLKYNRRKEDLKWIVKSAGRTKIVIAGGTKKQEENFLKDVYDIMSAGAAGLVVGRNVWQHKEPLKMATALRQIVFQKKKPKEAMKVLKY